MKEIKAFIKPNMIDYVIDALEALDNTPGITLSNVRGWGHRSDKQATAQLTDRIKLEIVVPYSQTDEVVHTIIQKARTGNYGDGKIFISSVDKAYRIRTGSEDLDALTYEQKRDPSQ